MLKGLLRMLDEKDMDRLHEADDVILKEADQAWRELAAGQDPIEVEPEFASELDRIVEAAEKELLA